jgi:hypothetical protein
MRRSRYLYTWIDWAKEILGWGLGLVIGFILLPVLGFILKLLWVFFMIGGHIIK